MNIRFRGRSLARLTCISSILLSAPALADHSGPSGVGGGAGLSVPGPGMLTPGQWAAGFRLTFNKPDDRSDAELAALAAEHVHAHNSDYVLRGALGLAYGVTDRLTLSAELPAILRRNLREGVHGHEGGQAVNGVADLGDVSGIGDLSLLAQYRLVENHPWSFALIAGVKAPTGRTGVRSPDGERLETEHQPGTGSWDALVGAAGAVEIGEWNLGLGGLYQFAGKGAQDTRLGDRAQGGFALSRHFGPGEHHDEGGAESAPHGHRSWDAFVELTGEWEGRQAIAGEVEADSGGKAVWLSPGARFTAASGWSIAGSVGVPVWQRIRPSHPDNAVRLTLAVGRAFR